jgi:hypothetical protein
MPYDPPGRADDLPESLLARWNATITKHYNEQFKQHGSRFITADPDSLPQSDGADIHWFADPAEPVTCFDRATARQLADWRRGRSTVQDEYAEYAIERRADPDGRIRPKRVQVTTELREYWATIAVADPDALAGIAEDALGRRPSMIELYGVDDPQSLEEPQREALFRRHLAGDDDGDPDGELNTANALFMINAINGLDDLIFIVMFGAQPYVVRLDDGTRRPATRDELFSLPTSAEILACRHADPVAAQGAHGAALDGRTVAFANPLGMYIKAFDDAALTLDGGALPDRWIRWGRGEEGMRQRLVVGPPDDDPRFLDDITVSVGAADAPLVGGFQILQLVEVGPLVIAGPQTAVGEHEFFDVPAIREMIDCTAEFACGPIRRLKERFDREQGGRRTGRRVPGGSDA